MATCAPLHRFGGDSQCGLPLQWRCREWGGCEGCILCGINHRKALAISPPQLGFISLPPSSRGGDPHREGVPDGSRTGRRRREQSRRRRSSRGCGWRRARERRPLRSSSSTRTVKSWSRSTLTPSPSVATRRRRSSRGRGRRFPATHHRSTRPTYARQELVGPRRPLRGYTDDRRSPLGTLGACRIEEGAASITQARGVQVTWPSSPGRPGCHPPQGWRDIPGVSADGEYKITAAELLG